MHHARCHHDTRIVGVHKKHLHVRGITMDKQQKIIRRLTAGNDFLHGINRIGFTVRRGHGTGDKRKSIGIFCISKCTTCFTLNQVNQVFVIYIFPPHCNQK